MENETWRSSQKKTEPAGKETFGGEAQRLCLNNTAPKKLRSKTISMVETNVQQPYIGFFCFRSGSPNVLLKSWDRHVVWAILLVLRNRSKGNKRRQRTCGTWLTQSSTCPDQKGGLQKRAKISKQNPWKFHECPNFQELLNRLAKKM